MDGVRASGPTTSGPVAGGSVDQSRLPAGGFPFLGGAVISSALTTRGQRGEVKRGDRLAERRETDPLFVAAWTAEAERRRALARSLGALSVCSYLAAARAAATSPAA